MPGIRGRKEKVRHPASDDPHCVTEGSQHLTDIDEHTAGGFDLPVGVVAFM
ncbi:MAG: hypothetical protein H0W53_13395 [Acidobacteria bacterium]|nr:hypothetical protein [Acidobacteriota bacterium]